MEGKLINKKRLWDESAETDSEVDLTEVKRLKENLLDGLEDDAEFCSTSQDLDSFIKSFEEEISASPLVTAAGGVEVAEEVDLMSELGESRPDLGYLLEASDDELGLPPTTSSSSGVVNSELRLDLDRVESGVSEVKGEFWAIPSLDSFVFGFGELENNDGAYGEYAPLDGLFDYSDLGSGSWRPGSLPAQ